MAEDADGASRRVGAVEGSEDAVGTDRPRVARADDLLGDDGWGGEQQGGEPEGEARCAHVIGVGAWRGRTWASNIQRGRDHRPLSATWSFG
jgi:hypothetical protein